MITYGKMRHDPQLKAVLAALTYPLLRANWAVDPEGCKTKVVQHVADDMGLPVLGSDETQCPARRRGISWKRHLSLVLRSKLVFGHLPCERRYEYDDSANLYHLVNLGARMPWTLAQIMLAEHGNEVEQVKQTTQFEPIPAQRLVWYVHEMEGAAWAGMSILRAAFGAWLLKQETWRVHATSIRRFGMGVPSVTAPAGASAAMVQQAQQLASSMRAGDQTGAGLPHGYTFDLRGVAGSVPDALAFIQYLDQQMSKMALAGVVDLGQTEVGSRALGETFLDLFTLALSGLADEVSEETTTGYPGMPGAVVDLVNVNYGEDEPCPRIVCTDVGEQHTVTAQAVSLLMQYGGLTADPGLEAELRHLWRLPQRETPQPAPVPAAGPPGPGQPPQPAPQPQPPAAPQPAAAGRGSRSRAAAIAGLRRELTPAEVRAGLDPIGMLTDWTAAMDWLIAHWTPLYHGMTGSLADQVHQVVDAGRLDKLNGLTVDVSAGVPLVKQAMTTLADKAQQQMLAEAEHQGVRLGTLGKIKAALLDRVAQARAGIWANWLAGQAGGWAMHAAGGKGSGADTADYVTTQLGGLSQRSLRDQLGAALTAAQNTGRLSVLEAAGPADYVATELLDENTCSPCIAEDGHVFASLDEARAAYPNGGYVNCAGFERCRGTVMGLWGDQ